MGFFYFFYFKRSLNNICCYLMFWNKKRCLFNHEGEFKDWRRATAPWWGVSLYTPTKLWVQSPDLQKPEKKYCWVWQVPKILALVGLKEVNRVQNQLRLHSNALLKKRKRGRKSRRRKRGRGEGKMFPTPPHSGWVPWPLSLCLRKNLPRHREVDFINLLHTSQFDKVDNQD